MAKKNKKKDEVQDEKPLAIIGAAITDQFCNYSYEVKSGVGLGDIHTVKGKGIIDADMDIAFFMLSVHLAVIDDAFKLSNIEVENIKSLHNHELAAKYRVTGFKIKGSDENESVILSGTKEVSCSGNFMNIESPKIPLTLSSYQWAEDLKEAVEKAREEVELYRGGKYTEVEQVEKENPNQLSIASSEVDFDSAAV